MKEQIRAFIEGGCKDFAGCGVYPRSLHENGDCVCFAADFGDKDVIIGSNIYLIKLCPALELSY